MLPLVRVVVLNFDGGDMTLDCLDSILASDWPADRLDVVMVDNGSLDDVVGQVAADGRYARVRVLEPLANLGFAGGCNLGIGQAGDHEYVALVNNDATVAPGWLRAMVPVAESDDRIGAVAAKMLFADRFHGIEFDVPDASHLVQRRDAACSASGSRACASTANGSTTVSRSTRASTARNRRLLRTGEELARWSSATAALRIASDGSDVSTISVRLSCLEPRVVTLRSGVDSTTVTVGDGRASGSTSRSRPSRST